MSSAKWVAPCLLCLPSTIHLIVSRLASQRRDGCPTISIGIRASSFFFLTELTRSSHVSNVTWAVLYPINDFFPTSFQDISIYFAYFFLHFLIIHLSFSFAQRINHYQQKLQSLYFKKKFAETIAGIKPKVEGVCDCVGLLGKPLHNKTQLKNSQ